MAKENAHAWSVASGGVRSAGSDVPEGRHGQPILTKNKNLRETKRCHTCSFGLGLIITITSADLHWLIYIH